MDELAAGRAAETLLAAHQANVPFKALGPPDRPLTYPTPMTSSSGSSPCCGARTATPSATRSD